MKLMAVFLICLLLPRTAWSEPKGCELTDTECILRSLDEEVLKREYLQRKLYYTQKELDLVGQWGMEQKKRAEKAEAENDNRISGGTWFLGGLGVGSLAAILIFVGVKK